MSSTTHAVGRRDTPMSLGLRIYVGAVIAAGALVLMTSVPVAVPRPMLALTFLAAMLGVSYFKLRIPLGGGVSTISMAYVIDFAVLVTLGLQVAVVIAAVGVLLQCTVNVRRRQPWYRTAFSVATVMLAVRAAGWALAASAGALPDNGAVLLSLVAAAAVYFVINSGLVAAAVAISTGQAPVPLWWQHFAATAPSCLGAAALVGTLVATGATSGYALLASSAVPLVMGHLAFAAWFRRGEAHG